MKEIKLYQCEVCGEQYSEKNTAAYCEKTHKDIKEIGKCRYDAKTAHPETIEISFRDGSKVLYYRGKKL